MIEQLREAFPQLDWSLLQDWPLTVRGIIGDLAVDIRKHPHPQGTRLYCATFRNGPSNLFLDYVETPVDAVECLRRDLIANKKESGVLEALFP